MDLIGHSLPSKKHAREVFGYFPNSFGSSILRTSHVRRSEKFAGRRSANLPEYVWSRPITSRYVVYVCGKPETYIGLSILVRSTLF